MAAVEEAERLTIITTHDSLMEPTNAVIISKQSYNQSIIHMQYILHLLHVEVKFKCRFNVREF